MAKEQDLTLDQDNAEEQGGGKKKLIIIIVAIVLLIGIAVGVTVFLMMGDSEESEDATAAESETAEMVEDIPTPAIYIKMKPRFVVNYNMGTRQRFLQASIEIMTRSQAVVAAVELHNPMLRNTIVGILSEQDFTQLRTPEGRSELKDILHEQLAVILQAEAGVEGIEAVLFTDFVMQ